MRTVITKEFEVIICDICGKESDIITKCRVCRKDICNDCRMWDQCEECWEDNCSFANIASKTEEQYGYGARSHTTTIINHESSAKWRDLLSRFHGERVKITIEKFPKHEEVKLKQWMYDKPTEWLEVKLDYKFEAIDGDNTKEWLEKCASLGIK